MTSKPAVSDAAERAGVSPAYVERLVELKVIGPPASWPSVESAVRRVTVVLALDRAGLPLTALGQAMETGALELGFVDQPVYEKFASMVDETFQEASDRSGAPLDLLLTIREGMGGEQASPGDRMRRDEVFVVPWIALMVRLGVRPLVVDGAIRAMGESLRRIADVESDWWRSDIMGPLLAAGRSPVEVGQITASFTDELKATGEDAMLALYRGQQASAWMRNIFMGFEQALEDAGLHTSPASPPAICFLDLTGYTRLTDEAGDAAAADLATRLTRLVQRTATAHGGKPVKWLGDGVMFHFVRPGPAVVAALEMVAGAATEGLPPAHVGLHAGPVLFQGGDYFGRTVNVASRIADYARPGEVIVSQEVVDAADGAQVEFTEIGPVELKGLSGALRLYSARPG